MSKIDGDALAAAARSIRTQAYAPCFHDHLVDAAILTPRGRIFVGANVENTAYLQGVCAETCAIGSMIAGGERRLTAVAVIGSGPDLCASCGGRQRLFEVSTDAIADGRYELVTIGDLPPRAFRPKPLPVA